MRSHLPFMTSVDEAPRVDAQASSERTGIGGWLLAFDSEGRPSPSTSRWFSHEVTKSEFSWVFERDEKPSLLISSLEALAVVIALKVFFRNEGSHSRKKLDLTPTWTDNRENGSALNKMMSTCFPSSALLMELHMKSTRVSRPMYVGLRGRPTEKQIDSPTVTTRDLTLHFVFILTWSALHGMFLQKLYLWVARLSSPMSTPRRPESCPERYDVRNGRDRMGD